MTAAVLAAVDIRKRFGALAVLDGVTLSLMEGEAVGVVGPNGAGKTTLLNVLSGALAPDSGSVDFHGRDVTSRGAADRCKLGIARTHQVPRPFIGMTVFENVLVGATAGGKRRGSEAYDLCLEVLDQTALTLIANRRAESLGLLQRKRLELARALAVEPSVLLLDEIGGGLTDAETGALVELVASLRDRGIAVLWIEHIVHLLMQVVSRLVCMDAGRIIAEGAPDDVVAQAAVIDAYLGARA
ncbi:MAG TPA: ABC transporter ATP-binding protein [Candidatus Dormibacteraeota bacterium]|jgi:branched-chain amino acid transport system ATP-binding protein|nr:ABC transporter ATP-binding protein [Candidatus Dormibacteraeota bacterium]